MNIQFSHILSVKVHAGDGLQKGVSPAETVVGEVDGHFGWPAQGGVTDHLAVGTVDVASEMSEFSEESKKNNIPPYFDMSP